MSSGGLPTIIFAHGAFHRKDAFDACSTHLETAGYKVVIKQNPTASSDPDTIAHGFEADVAQVHDEARKAAAMGADVVLVGHSYGGVLITEAAKGLAKGSSGLSGGVVRLVYICAFAPDVGQSLISTSGGKAADWIIPVVRG